MSAWESFVGLFQVCQTYNFYNVRVRSFRNDKVLSLTQQSKFSLCEHPKQVQVTQEPSNDECHTIDNATIIGLTNLVIHRSCKKCKGKLNPKNTALWVCCNCNMVQTIANVVFEFSATLVCQDLHKTWPQSSDKDNIYYSFLFRRLLYKDQRRSRGDHPEQHKKCCQCYLQFTHLTCINNNISMKL